MKYFTLSPFILICLIKGHQWGGMGWSVLNHDFIHGFSCLRCGLGSQTFETHEHSKARWEIYRTEIDGKSLLPEPGARILFGEKIVRWATKPMKSTPAFDAGAQ